MFKGTSGWLLTRCRDRLQLEHHSGGVTFEIDGTGLGNVRVHSSACSRVLLLDGAELAVARPDPRLAWAPCPNDGAVGNWTWSWTEPNLDFLHTLSGRTIRVRAESVCIRDSSGAERYYGGPEKAIESAAQEQIQPLLDSATANPKEVAMDPLAKSADLARPICRVLKNGEWLEVSLPVQLSEKDLQLLEFLIRSGKLSEEELYRRNPRDANRLESIKQKLAAGGAPLIETREGIQTFRPLPDWVRRVDE